VSDGAAIGILIVGFAIGSDGSRYDRNQPCYGDRRWWRHESPPQRGQPTPTPNSCLRGLIAAVVRFSAVADARTFGAERRGAQRKSGVTPEVQ